MCDVSSIERTCAAFTGDDCQSGAIDPEGGGAHERYTVLTGEVAMVAADEGAVIGSREQDLLVLVEGFLHGQLDGLDCFRLALEPFRVTHGLESYIVAF